MNRVLKRIRQDKKEFITLKELKKYCKELYFNYKNISDYLVSRGYLVRILDDIFYVKTVDEISQKKLKYSILELVGKGLILINVPNWYFGLYTALKLNKIDYDHKNRFFYLINNKISKNKLIKILDNQFRFLKFKNSLFNFGIINKKIRYSNLEKTILDLIYLWEYNHMNENRILIKLSKLLDGISEEKILEYSHYYPKSNKSILKKALKE